MVGIIFLMANKSSVYPVPQVGYKVCRLHKHFFSKTFPEKENSRRLNILFLKGVLFELSILH